MKRTLLFFGILLVAGTVHAQDILKNYGCNKEILTLSKGRYKETFINENVMQIGTVLIDTRTEKVVKFLEEDTTEVSYKADDTSRFMTIDPVAEKYPELSPYVYCRNNPMRFVNPTGMIVETDELSQNNIKNTLTDQEAKYVRFNNNGVLDAKRLNKSKSTSDNMTALKTLAKSELVYNFQVTKEDHEGNSFYDKTATGGNFYRGVTEMPGAESNPSPDNKIYVLVGEVLNKKQQVMTTAHEGLGHAYFYEITRNVEKASHTYKSEGRMVWDEEIQMNVFETTKVPTNISLENQINKVVKQAENNYDKKNN
ncbi:MAG: hypothetical protein FWF52_07325 [Candidatus Azobacteroides sp.]|nr:hypothetical protein [Candidatus Azobacteroides sp.]